MNHAVLLFSFVRLTGVFAQLVLGVLRIVLEFLGLMGEAAAPAFFGLPVSPWFAKKLVDSSPHFFVMKGD